MYSQSTNNRAVLKRRSSISNTLQAGLDGLAVIGITLGLVHWHFGELSKDYALLLLLLMGILAVVYDRYALYRTNTNFTTKVFVLLKSWAITFLILLLLAFLTKQTETYSRVLIGELFVLGFLAQAFLHWLTRTIQRNLVRQSQKADQVIMIGEGRLANYLQQRISSNPWLGQQVSLLYTSDAADEL